MPDDCRLHCARACERLCLDFAYTVDQRDYAACINLFAEDGLLEHVTGPLKGRAAILAMLEARPLDVVTRHTCTNIVVEPISDTEAQGRSYVTLYKGTATAGFNGPVTADRPLVAQYTDRYALIEGHWKIQHRKTTLVFA